jgi:hypothetical protein
MSQKELFHIKSEQEVPAQAVLLIRAGESHLCFAVCNGNGRILHELVYNQSTMWDAAQLDVWYSQHPVLQQSFFEVHITWDFPAATLVPSAYYRMEEARNILQQVIGPQPLHDVVSELVAAWQLYCIYAVPVVVREWMQQHFPAAQFRHQISTALKQPDLTADETLLVDFRNGSFNLIAFRQHNLLLAHDREYQTPEDVIYYLLRACETFGLNRETAILRISGFIDRDSSLYRELYCYFLHPEFREAGWQSSDALYPQHYFTAVNDLYPCVS